MNHAVFPLPAQAIVQAMAREVQVKAFPVEMVTRSIIYHLTMR